MATKTLSNFLVLWLKPSPESQEPCFFCQHPSSFLCEHYVDSRVLLHNTPEEIEQEQAEKAWGEAFLNQQQGKYQCYITTSHCSSCMLEIVVKWIGIRLAMAALYQAIKEPGISLALCAAVQPGESPIRGTSAIIPTQDQTIEKLAERLNNGEDPSD